MRKYHVVATSFLFCVFLSTVVEMGEVTFVPFDWHEWFHVKAENGNVTPAE